MIRALFQVALALAFAGLVEAAGRVTIYDELADANRDIAAAVAQAEREHKLVLLVFGANWCPDCRALNEDMGTAEFGSLLAERYVVVKIDVGRFKKNMDVGARYGVPLSRGIPAAGIVGADGRTRVALDGDQLAHIMKGGPPALAKYFDTGAFEVPKPKWRPTLLWPG